MAEFSPSESYKLKKLEERLLKLAYIAAYIDPIKEVIDRKNKELIQEMKLLRNEIDHIKNGQLKFDKELDF